MTVTVGKIEKRVQAGRSKALEWIQYDPNYSHNTPCKEEKWHHTKCCLWQFEPSNDKLHLQVHICYKVAQSKHSTPSSQNVLARSDRRISQSIHRQIPIDTCVSILDDIIQRLLHVSRGQNRQHVNGPKGHPNNLPQSAWRLAELFFWSDLSWSQAELCANSYVISTCFCLLSTMPLCTHYISNIGIGRFIHNVLFIISMHGLFVTLDPTDFQVIYDCSCFLSFK